MNRRNKTARTLAVLGSLVLFVLAGLHSFVYTQVSPGVSASNLSASLQSVFRIAFLEMAWHWLVLGSIVLLAVFAETRLRKALLLICGIALLAETGLTLAFASLFIGNEMTGTAGLLILCSGLLFEPVEVAGYVENSARVQSPS